MALIFCPECGTQVSEHAEACSKCAYPIAKLNFKQAASTTNNINKGSSGNNSDFSGVDYYYQQQFEEIQKSGESYKGSWNWFAFLFTWIWCLTKGLWGYALLWFVIVGGTLLAGKANEISLIVIGVIYAIIMGWRGTWAYYNLKTKGKQFPN